MKIKLIFFQAILLVVLTSSLYADQVQVIEREGVSILFEPPLERAAMQLVDIYGETRAEVEDIFGWRLGSRPSIFLVKDRRRFQQMAGNPLTVAYALPKKNMLVIDYSRMNTHPFTLENTLKHELCHLLLHHHIKGHILPRWLDEGVCQWASGGLADIIMNQRMSLLNKAAFRRAFIPLGSLKVYFPADKKNLMLAYEESKSFVSYIISKFGKEGLLEVLQYMKDGESMESAFLNALLMPLRELETKWQYSLTKKATWFTIFSYYLYEILFGFTALISILAFIKIIRKKHAYMAEDSEDGFL
ncbi:MAG: hypothetical protein GY864_08170 [Desulfobacterales bacterium]|nr:hypothetical protein [Desulfobacterales bacterium]